MFLGPNFRLTKSQTACPVRPVIAPLPLLFGLCLTALQAAILAQFIE